MPSKGAPRQRACCSSWASESAAACRGNSYAHWYTVASVVPYVLMRVTPRRSHARIVAAGIGSPPSISVVSVPRPSPSPSPSPSRSNSCHTDGVEHACVARVSSTDSRRCCSVNSHGARQTAAPTASAANVSPADGSKMALVATKTREAAARWYGCAAAVTKAAHCSGVLCMGFGVPVVPLVWKVHTRPCGGGTCSAARGATFTSAAMAPAMQ